MVQHFELAYFPGSFENCGLNVVSEEKPCHPMVKIRYETRYALQRRRTTRIAAPGGITCRHEEGHFILQWTHPGWKDQPKFPSVVLNKNE